MESPHNLVKGVDVQQEHLNGLVPECSGDEFGIKHLLLAQGSKSEKILRDATP